jgi:hypothetical protein
MFVLFRPGFQLLLKVGVVPFENGPAGQNGVETYTESGPISI